jgi:tetratricopeptide (TPR) repeat protein
VGVTREVPALPSDPCRQDSGVGKEAVASALDRIIQSKVLEEAPRLRALLEFIVTRSLCGNTADLKETVLAAEIFEKAPDFDPRLDATVRVAINRLRAKLKSYYGTEGAEESILIEVPEGHYLPRFSVRQRRPAIVDNGRSGSNARIVPWISQSLRFDGRAFVGRDAELRHLEDHLARSVEGHGNMVCIVAEPGVGKTALVETFIENACQTNGLVYAIGRCRQELEHTESYLPWLEILEELVCRDSSIETLLQAAAPTWWNRLRLQKPDARAQECSVKREMRRFLQALADRLPLVLVLEDLHWADTSTVDLIAYLGPALSSLRLLLLGSYRPSALDLAGNPFLKIEPELKMHRVCEDLPLAELSLSDARRYLELRFPDNTFSAEVADHLQMRSEGNALCLTAMVDHAIGRGWIISCDGRWQLATPLQSWDRELPQSIRSMVGVKLAALAQFDRELLSAAAVLGAEFDLAVLAHALNLDETFVEERFAGFHSTHRILRAAVDLRLAGRPARGYRFAHVLYREGLLQALEPARYSRLCSLLAHAMVAVHGETDPCVVGNVARLLSEAGAGEPSLKYFALAAGHAVELSAYRQAFDLASQAAEIARHCPPSESVKRLEIDFLTTEALSLTSLEGFAAAEIEQIYQRARQIAEELGDVTAVTSIAHLHWGLVSIVNLKTAQELADVLWKDANASQNIEARALARMAQGIALFHLGSIAEGTVVLQDAADQWRRLEGALGFRSFMLDPAVATQCNLARALWFIGKPDQAWRTALETVDLAYRIGHHRTTSYALALAADVAHLRRDASATLQWSEKAVEMAREHEFLYEATWARILQGWVLSQTGDIAQAIAIFESASEYRGPSSTKFLCHFAEALGRRESYDKAFAVLENAFRLAEQRGERYYVSELERVRGELAARSGDCGGIELAEQMLTKAVQIARQSRAGSCELRALSSLACFYLEFRPASARRALEDLRRLVTGLPETAGSADGADARRLLQRTA